MNGTSEIIYEFARASSLEGWWIWALLLLAIGILLFSCVRFYRRDAAELNQPVRWTLIMLRLAAIVALIFFFFDLQRRTQRMVTRSSEVVVLVDTSQSMSLPAEAMSSSQSRSQRAAEILGETDLLDRLDDEHRVSLYAFDDQSEPRLLETRGGDRQSTDESETIDAKPAVSGIALLGAIALSIAGLLSLASFFTGATGRTEAIGWILLPAAVAMILGILTIGGVFAVRSQESLSDIFGVQKSDDPKSDDEIDSNADEPAMPKIVVTDWDEAVAASGAQSRIGDSIRSVLGDHDPSTLAGIILLSDGQANGGSEVTASVAFARRSEVALYPVGLGSSSAPINVRVVDLDAPKRVYPGDKFAITGVLQASGPKPIEVEVQLLDGLDDGISRDENDQVKPPGDVIESKKVSVASDGTLTGIRFELDPETVGRRRLAIRVVSPNADQSKRDDMRDARYEVVARKLRVLLVAGGPTREYRFVRNLLNRDKSTEVDVWLQTGQRGMSQDADRVLSEFPSEAEALFDYDAIAMFDPNWLAISATSLDLLDRWLAQQAGGMLLVAGPVYHPRWSRLRTDPRVSKISGFFPVNVSTRGPLLGGGRQGGENAWPIEFTPEARRAEFLWIADRPEESFGIWDRFGGVYDYVGVKNAKPGAKVYGYFSDPTTQISDTLPVFMASQFYGAGRVFFQGSGEIWRLRGESDAYFDSYYTKLIRWVSEGRLLRDSNRGILLVDNSRAMVGDTIVVRAVLTDAQFEPLNVSEVSAKLLAPSGRIDDIRLLPLKGEPRPGTYGGRFIAREAGSYEIRLTLGDALSEQVLRQSVQVRLPTIELERPKRNDKELAQYASMTGGIYTRVDPGTTSQSVANTLSSTLKPQPQTTVLPGTPDQEFSGRRNAMLLWLIASVLTMEWVTRRLHRLA